MTTKVLYAGCSYTAGSGLFLEKEDPNLWVNQFHDKFFPNSLRLNVSRGGRSNAGIFQDTVKQLALGSISHAFVAWTSMPRYELELGLELYETRQCFIPNSPCSDHKLNNMVYNAKYLNNIRDRFTTLAHEYYEISNLIEYTNTIKSLAELTNSQVFFINAWCPWDLDFFALKHNVLPDQYTKYTQKLLQLETRDDTEVFALYDKMHNNFSQLGGINKDDWLNLYESFCSNKIDVNADGFHPGPKSNSIFVEILSESFKDKINLI